MKCVGIDIGSFSVKVADIDVASNAQSATVSRVQEFRFSPDPQRDRQLQIIETLRSLATQYDLSSTRFAIAAPQHASSGRLRRFPFRERAKIIKSIPFELEDDIPLDPDETIFDAKITEFVGAGAEAWCVAVPREVVKETLQSALEGSIDADIVSVEGLALANLFEVWQSAPPEAPVERAAVPLEDGPPPMQRPARVTLSIGHSRTLALIYRDGALCSVRSLAWGGQDVANALAATFNVPYFEALKILQEKSFVLMNKAGATRDQIAMSESVAGAVDLLTRPLRLTLLEARSDLNLTFSAIELVGGASQIQNLAPYLTQALEVPCNLASPLSSLSLNGVDASSQTQASAALAVGLAIEAAKRPRNPALNLRRGEFARQNLSARRLWDKWNYAAKVASAGLMALVVYGMVRDGVALDLADKAQDALMTVAKSSAGIAKPSESAVRKHIDHLKKQIKARETLASLDEYNSALDVLLKISQAVPAQDGGSKVEMNVSSFNVDNDDVQMQGTIDVAHSARLKEWLQKAARPGTVKESTYQGSPGALPGKQFAFTMKASRLP